MRIRSQLVPPPLSLYELPRVYLLMSPSLHIGVDDHVPGGLPLHGGRQAEPLGQGRQTREDKQAEPINYYNLYIIIITVITIIIITLICN